MKHSRYLKNAEDNLKKAVLLDDYSNRCFKITTKISKSAKYRIRNPTKIIKGANYESDASDISESSNMEQSEANYDCDASDAMDISPPESSEEELSSNEADLVWLDPELLKKADSLESGEIPELFQLLTKNDLAELGKSEFGKLVRTFFFDNLGSYKRLGPAKFEKIFNSKLKLLFRNHNPEERGLDNHFFVIRGSDRQIWLFEDRNKIEKVFDDQDIHENSVRVTDHFFENVISNVEESVFRQRDENYRNFASVKHALTEMGVFFDDDSFYRRVLRRLHKNGWMCEELDHVRPCISETTRKERLEYAQWVVENFEKNPDFHNKIIFSDECSFKLNDTTSNGLRTWRLPGENLEPASFKVKVSSSVMVWGAVGFNYKSPLIFFLEERTRMKNGQETISYKNVSCGSETYRTIVLEPFFADLKQKGLIVDNKLQNYYYSQDGAPAHTSCATLNFIDEQIGLENTITKIKAFKSNPELAQKIAHNWPGSSPDLNVLDWTVWNSFKRRSKLKLGKKGYFSNFGEAKEILTSVWDELTQEEINNMIKGLKGRAEDVVESQGRFREGQKLNRGAFTKN